MLFKGLTSLYIPKRIIFTLLAFLGVIIIFAIRVNLSVTIVVMVNNTKETSSNESLHAIACPSLLGNVSQTHKEEYKGPQYNWDSKTQSLILSSFFYGYILTQLPGGMLCERFGAKWLFGIGILVNSSLYLLIPLAASWGVPAIVAIRVLEGLGEGTIFPAITHAVSNWAPKSERSRISSTIFLGFPVGSVITMPISGFLSSYDPIGGWPSTYYIIGTLGCVWFVIWSIFAYETPELHPSISKEELLYIQQNRKEKPQKKIATPWKAIFTSLPVWAVIIAHFSNNYALLMLLTETPIYFRSILHFDIKLNGVLSALPYIVSAVGISLSSYTADKLRESNKLSITNIRKLINSIGFVGPGLCLLCITQLGCRPMLIVAFLCLCQCLTGFIFSGFNVIHVDMSPDFAGILYGITNTVGNMGGIVGPMVVGVLTSNGDTLENWNIAFYITTIIYILSATFFVLFASAEVQPWGVAGKEASETPKPAKITFVEATVN